MRNFLFLIILACCGIHSLQAQQILLDKPTRAGELILFPELGETHNYFYVPDKPRLGIHPDGKPMFSFLRFVKNEDTNAEVNTAITTSQTGGGVVHALVELSVSDEQVKVAERALQRLDAGGKVVGPVVFKSGTVALVSAVATKDGGYAQTVVGLGSAPILENQKAAVAVLLNPLGAKILWETFNTPTPDFSIQFEMEVAGFLAPKRVTIEADFDQMYKHKTFEAAIAMPVLQAEISMAFDELINNGSIKVTQVGEDASLDRVRDAACTQLMSLMFERVGGTGVPQMNQLMGMNNRPGIMDRASTMLRQSREEEQKEQARLAAQNNSNNNSSRPAGNSGGTTTSGTTGTTGTTSGTTGTTGGTTSGTTSGTTGTTGGTTGTTGGTTGTTGGTTGTTGGTTGTTGGTTGTTGGTTGTTGGTTGTTGGTTGTTGGTTGTTGGTTGTTGGTTGTTGGTTGTTGGTTGTTGGRTSGNQPATNSQPQSGTPANTGNAPQRSSGGSSLAIAISYQMRETKQKGKYRIDFNKFTETVRPMPFAYNPGNVRKQCPECFREVNLDDPLMQQRDINATLGGMNASDFAQYVNFVNVVLRKKHENGEETVKEIKIDKTEFNRTGNFAKMQYGYKGDKNRLNWLNYEFKTKWSFFGDYSLETPWKKSDFGSIALEPPFVRKVILLEADPDFIAAQNIRAVEVAVFSKLVDKVDQKNTMLKTNKNELSRTVEILLPRNVEEFEYEITWFIKGREPQKTERKKSQFGRIDLDHF